MTLVRGTLGSGGAAMVLCLAVGLGGCHVNVASSEAGEGAQACYAAMACPQPKNPCQRAYCVEEQCELYPVAQGSLPQALQTEGDCQRAFCDGNGKVVAMPASQDKPADDGNPCTEERCEGLSPVHKPTTAGSPCAGGSCNGAGQCVPWSGPILQPGAVSPPAP